MALIQGDSPVFGAVFDGGGMCVNSISRVVICDEIKALKAFFMTSASLSQIMYVLFIYLFIFRKKSKANWQFVFYQTIVILMAFNRLRDWIALYHEVVF